MSRQPIHERTLSRGDVAAMWVFIIFGVAFAAYTVARAIVRMVEVAANDDVRVFARFDGTMADAPIGPDGAPVAVELDAAHLLAPELPVAAVGALLIEQLVIIVTVLTVIGCLLALLGRILRGRMFNRTNTVLVTTAGLVGLIGYALTPFFANMGANGAFARISDRTFDNVVLAVDLVPFVGIAFVAALASTAFTVGDRLQRDTEGLV